MHWLLDLRVTSHLLCKVLPALVATSVAAGDFAFVTNQNSSDLSILDLEKGVERLRIPVPGQPAGVAVHPASGNFFTVSPDSKTVRKFDLVSGSEIAAITLDGGPIGIAVEPSGARIFVSDWYNARIWVIDANAMEVLTMLATGSAPAGLVVTDDGSWLASADRDANQVSIFDLDTLTLRRRVTVGERPFGVSVGPSGRIYSANVGSNSVSVLDPQTGRIEGTVPSGIGPTAWPSRKVWDLSRTSTATR